MIRILAVIVLSSTTHFVRAVPAPQQFYSQEYYTHSLYPSYEIRHQSLPINSYSNLLPQTSTYLQQPSPSVNPVPLNSSEFKNIEANFQATVQKIKNENEQNQAVKQDQKVDVKSTGVPTPGSISVVNPFFVIGKTPNGADFIKSTLQKDSYAFGPPLTQHSSDPIFGPELGARYELHYPHSNLSPPLPYFSSYPSFPAQPAFPVYSDFSTYAGYPSFGGNNQFVGFSNGGVQLTQPNGNNIGGVSPSSQGPDITTASPSGEVSGYPTSGDGASSEPSTEAVGETSTDSSIGAPPSIDGPGKLSKKKRRPGKNTKKQIHEN